jgi:hypothetical protein
MSENKILGMFCTYVESYEKDLLQNYGRSEENYELLSDSNVGL